MANTLRVSLEKVDFRQPTQVTDDTSVLTLKNCVFEPLLKWQPGGLVSPALFDTWEHSDQGRVWRFHIRDDAMFHDGVACGAHHIVAFIAAIIDSRDTFGMKWSYHRYLAKARIIAEDQRTLKVENTDPMAWIQDIFTEFYIARVDSNGEPVLGTGRYRVASFDKGAGRADLEYTRKIDESSQSPQRIIVTAEPSAEKRLQLLREGKTDVAMNLERVEEALDFSEKFQWRESVNTLSVMCYLNCHEGIFTSPRARLAVNHALDTVKLSKEVFNGLAAPSANIVSPFHLGSQKAGPGPIPYDQEKARQLLEGLDLSKPVRIRTPTYMPERAQAITEFVAASLEAVGLKVSIEVEHDRPLYARQIGLEKNVGDIALFDSSPHSTFRVLDDKISSQTHAVWWQGYHNPEVDRLIAEANNTVIESEREISYGKCLEALKKDPAWLYLLHPIQVYAAKLGLRGLSIDHKGVLNIS